MEQQPDLTGIDLDRTIFRVPRDKEHPYMMTARATPRNRNVSLAARGLLWLMLSFPDDWDFNARHLAAEAGCGRTLVSQLLLELVGAGHIRRETQGRRGGRFGRIRYLVYEVPTVSASTVSVHADTVIDVAAGQTDTENHRVRETVVGGTAHGGSSTTEYSPETEYRKRESPPPAASPTAQEPESNYTAAFHLEPSRASALFCAMGELHMKRRLRRLFLSSDDYGVLAGIAERFEPDRVCEGFRRFLAKHKDKAVHWFLVDFESAWLPPERPKPVVRLLPPEPLSDPATPEDLAGLHVARQEAIP